MTKYFDYCPDCSGSGMSFTARLLHRKWDGFTFFMPSEKGSIPFSNEDELVQRRAKDVVGLLSKDFNFLADLSPQSALDLELRNIVEYLNSKWCFHLTKEELDFLDSKGFLAQCRDYLGAPSELTSRDFAKWQLMTKGLPPDHVDALIAHCCYLQNQPFNCHCKHAQPRGEAGK